MGNFLRYQEKKRINEKNIMVVNDLNVVNEISKPIMFATNALHEFD